jgi:hypothetical protein
MSRLSSKTTFSGRRKYEPRPISTNNIPKNPNNCHVSSLSNASSQRKTFYLNNFSKSCIIKSASAAKDST